VIAPVIDPHAAERTSCIDALPLMRNRHELDRGNRDVARQGGKDGPARWISR
jgi:hypothetical protein